MKDINYLKDGNCDPLCRMFSRNYATFVTFYRTNNRLVEKIRIIPYFNVIFLKKNLFDIDVILI